ncbi:MAG: M15 family metallopeptidase [Oscillospiraceae bacterium]|nr:M15 family metallopeptidase [Oscillospiraceae bacterium]
MEKQRKKRKYFLPFLGAFVSLFVFFVCCVILFLEIYAYRDGREKAANAGAASSAVSSGRSSPQSSAGASSAAAIAVTDQNLILVNYSHKLPDGYLPDLVSVYGVQLNRRAAAAYQKMNSAAASDGISLWISSAYRSVERQEELFRQEIADYSKSYSSQGEAQAYAEQSVARPGYSEHATGLAMDLNGVRNDFDEMPAFQWLSEHAQDYGFILRYPKDKQNITKIKYEPWHYRYVGVEHAQSMKEKNLCLEEYLDLR